MVIGFVHCSISVDKGGYHVGDKTFTAISRGEAVAILRKDISFVTQLKDAMWNMLGPMAILNSLVAGLLLPYFISPPDNTSEHVFTWTSVWDFCIMYLIGDLGLYWGHRIQHDIEYLWLTRHSYHHKIGSPTPVSTVYIDRDDATLQVSAKKTTRMRPWCLLIVSVVWVMVF